MIKLAPMKIGVAAQPHRRTQCQWGDVFWQDRNVDFECSMPALLRKLREQTVTRPYRSPTMNDRLQKPAVTGRTIHAVIIDDVPM